jgi:hypothetical protein
MSRTIETIQAIVEFTATVGELLQSGKTIAACRFAQAQLGLSLKDAKALIDGLRVLDGQEKLNRDTRLERREFPYNESVVTDAWPYVWTSSQELSHESTH